MIAGRDRGRQAGRDQSWVMLLGPRAEPKPLQGRQGINLSSLAETAAGEIRSQGERHCWPESKNRWVEKAEPWGRVRRALPTEVRVVAPAWHASRRTAGWPQPSS